MLSDIIDVAFEPFLISSIVGIILIYITHEKGEALRLHRVLLIIIILMLLWRFLWGTKSSRHWAVIIFPVLTYSGIFCWSIAKNWKIPVLLIVIIGGIAIGKNLHINPHSKYLLNASDTIIADAKNYRRPIIIEAGDSNASRLEYYTGIPAINDDFSANYLQNEMQGLRGLYDVVYLVFSTSNRLGMSESLKLQRFNPELIFEQFRNRKERDKIYVYRIPVEKMPEPLYGGEILFRNGNFEELAPQQSPGGRKPKLWGATHGLGVPLECQTTTENVIHGTRSLYLQYFLKFTLFPLTRVKISDNGIFSFWIANADGVTLWARVHVVGANGKLRRVDHLVQIPINTNQKHQFQFYLKAEDYLPDDTISIHWSIMAPDGCQMDDIEFYRDAEASM